jgi:hypothetical protein
MERRDLAKRFFIAGWERERAESQETHHEILYNFLWELS